MLSYGTGFLLHLCRLFFRFVVIFVENPAHIHIQPFVDTCKTVVQYAQVDFAQFLVNKGHLVDGRNSHCPVLCL